MISIVNVIRFAMLGPLPVDTGAWTRAPIFNLLGSYFPAWILCFVVGVTVALLAHYLFVRVDLVRYLWPLSIVYPALTCLVACGLWLLCFR